MNKFINILRIICIICWIGVITIAIIRPEMDTRIPFFIAVGVVIIQNLTDLITNKYNDREIKRTNC